jgi:peroxin-4
MATRLMKEFREASQSKDTDIRLSVQDNLYKWTAHIQGPPGTPFDGGTFVVQLDVMEDYPLRAPKARFVTKIFHPNIHFKSGEVCLDILKTAWTPAWTLQSVCRAIIALLSNAEADSPLNCDAGNLLRSNDIRGYNSMARMYTALHATPQHPAAQE